MPKFKHDEFIENGKYMTSDFYSAAYVRASGCRMLRAEWRNDRCYFVFDNTNLLTGLMGEYFNDTARVAPKRFSDEIKRLKFEMYESKGRRDSSPSAEPVRKSRYREN